MDDTSNARVLTPFVQKKVKKDFTARQRGGRSTEAAWNYPDLHPYERLMLIKMIHHLDFGFDFTKQTFFHSAKQWAEELNINEKSARRHAKSLHDKNLWIQTAAKKRGQIQQHLANTYQLTDKIFKFLEKKDKKTIKNRHLKSVAPVKQIEKVRTESPGGTVRESGVRDSKSDHSPIVPKRNPNTIVVDRSVELSKEKTNSPTTTILKNSSEQPNSQRQALKGKNGDNQQSVANNKFTATHGSLTYDFTEFIFAPIFQGTKRKAYFPNQDTDAVLTITAHETGLTDQKIREYYAKIRDGRLAKQVFPDQIPSVARLAMNLSNFIKNGGLIPERKLKVVENAEKKFVAEEQDNEQALRKIGKFLKKQTSL